MRPALILIDLQQDYLHAPGLEPSKGSIVRQAAKLLTGGRALSIPIIHVWTTVNPEDDRRMRHWKEEGRWICLNGTEGHAPPQELTPLPGEAIFHKSAFNAFADGELDRFLRDRQVDTLLFAGVHLHACVRQAVLHAYEHSDARLYVAEDATGSDDPVHAAITRRYLEDRSIHFLPVQELLDLLQAEGMMRDPLVEARALVRSGAQRCEAAQRAWQATALDERIAIFEKLALRLEDETSALAQLLAVETGLPVRFGGGAGPRSAQMLRAVISRVRSAPLIENAGSCAQVRRRPAGVIGVITPWNNPIYISLGKLAPALLYGNGVLWKPSPLALEVAKRVMEFIREAGLPADLLTLVDGGRHAAEAVMRAPVTTAVTLTGSALAGSSAQEICARRHIPLQAELGGNNVSIVWPDADLSQAARQIASGAFAMAGQRCTANRRVIVHESCRAEFLELLRSETEALPWGDPYDAVTVVGPMVNAAHRERVAAFIEGARRDGVEMIPLSLGTDIATLTRECEARFAERWLPPTLLCCQDPAHEVVQYETFGPLLVVQVAESWDEAISLANGVRQGLAASIFTQTTAVANRFLDQAQAGILKVNRTTADADIDVPFGGWKGSGIGPPEHGVFDLDFFTRPQTVYKSEG